MKKKFFIDYTGCYRSHVDMELISGLLYKNGFIPVHNTDSADIIIFVGCGFIDSAKEESIERIIELAYSKNKNAILIVGGCIFRRDQKELRKEIIEVDYWVDGSNPKDFLNVLKRVSTEKNLKYPEINGDRLRFGFPHIGYIKISEGCRRFCSYCAIPYIRGELRSRKLKNILDEVKLFKDQDVKEFIFISQDSSSYAFDFKKKNELIKIISETEKIIDNKSKIRLLYLHPLGVTDELVELFKGSKKLVKTIEIPIQHFSDKILKRMNRNYTEKYLNELIEKIRNSIPEIAIRTTILTGFPGENEEDILCLLNNLKKHRFERVGIFSYSREKNTKAYNFKNQVLKKDKEIRKRKLENLTSKIMIELDKKRIGKRIPCIIDAFYLNFAVGRTCWDLPDIDKNIYIEFKNKKCEIGSWVDVLVTDVKTNNLYGIL